MASVSPRRTGGGRGGGATDPESRAIVERADLDVLVDVLRAQGHRVVAPTVRDGAVVLDDAVDSRSLPDGWVAEQEPGSVRLRPDPSAGAFDHAAAGGGWKALFFPPESLLFRAAGGAGRWRPGAETETVPPAALLGVRPCDLAAIAVQDRVFLGGAHRDRIYEERRRDAVIVAVACRRPTATCFCASMGTGPAVGDGADLALTEVVDGERHHFVAAASTERGAALLEAVPHRPATAGECAEAVAAVDAAASAMVRHLDPATARTALRAAAEHPRWDDVARRCLACGSCTLVCPTCFCSTVEDGTDLDNGGVSRTRRWDTCFGSAHSYIHGGSIRASVRARYRQWLTHKLSTWVDQFGVGGCTGCGRCIAWCPVGIDITAEVAAMTPETPAAAAAAGGQDA